MTNLYHADENTGKFTGTVTDAEKVINPKYDPDTHSIGDKYLFNPLTSSLEEPKSTEEGRSNFLVGGSWVVMADIIGQEYYEPDGTKKAITTKGETIPEGCITDPPPSDYHITHDGSEWQLDEQAQWDGDMAAWEGDMTASDMDLMPRWMEVHIEMDHNGQVGDLFLQSDYDAKKALRDTRPQ